MEDFTKMIEAYRWRGEEPYTKKQHRDLCASLCASPAQATPRNAEEEQAGSSVVCCSYKKKKNKGRSSSPNASCLPINRSYMEPQNVRRVARIQTDQFEPKIWASDDDGDVGSLDRALSVSSGLYTTGQRRRLKKKSQASSHSRSSRQLVFSGDMDAESDLKGRAILKKKFKKERMKSSGQTQKKQSRPKVPLKSGTAEDYMPEFYDSSTCEDGPIEFSSPNMAFSPVVASQPYCFEGSNTPALNKRKRRLATPSIYVARRVSMNGKSPFFAHTERTPDPNNAKKTKKTLSSSTPLENKTASVKVYTRRRKKANPILSKDSDTMDADEGHLMEPLEWKDQTADTCKGAVMCVNSGVLPSKATSKAKTSAYFTDVVKALGQRDIVNKTWVPPISVYALIQEELYQDPWKVLVACMLLNKTCGTQMRKVIWDLFDLCPTPEAAVAVETEKVEEVIRPLGLQKKRARMIQKFSEDYLGKEWVHVGELHGIGKYATDAYAIFCEGRWREVKPEDHKLVDYWRYLCATDGFGYAFKDDRAKGREVDV